MGLCILNKSLSYTAGEGINITNGIIKTALTKNIIQNALGYAPVQTVNSQSGNVNITPTSIGAQPILTAGNGINISNNQISNVFTRLKSPNLNNIKYNYQGCVSNATNVPTGANAGGFLCVFASDDTAYYMQLYSEYNTDKTWIRKFYSNTWTSWTELALKLDFNDAFMYKGVATGDIDNFKGTDKLGYYSVTSSLTGNKPTPYGILLLFRRYNNTIQMWISYPSNSSSPTSIYTRTWKDTYWTSWTTYVTGVKGNAESTYRTGNVNLTPANIGAPTLSQFNDSLKWGLDLSSVIFFGDSFVEGYGLENPSSENWCKKLADKLGLSSSQYIIRGKGGCGFAHKSQNGNMTFTDYWNSISSSLPNNVTTIIIMGGLNDRDQIVNNKQGIINGISSLMKAIRSKYSNVSKTKIVYMFNPTILPAKRDLIDTCYRYLSTDCILIDSWWWALFEGSWVQYTGITTADKPWSKIMHPSKSGTTFIANYAKTILFGGNVLHRKEWDLGKNGNKVTFVANNDKIDIKVSATHDGSARNITIGEFPQWLPYFYIGTEQSIDKFTSGFGPKQFSTFMTPFVYKANGTNPTGTDFGYIQFGNSSKTIWLCSMTKNGSNWNSGKIQYFNTIDALDGFDN